MATDWTSELEADLAALASDMWGTQQRLSVGLAIAAVSAETTAGRSSDNWGRQYQF